MTLRLDPDVAAALATLSPDGPPAPLAVGDVAGRRAVNGAMIAAVNDAQPAGDGVTTTDHVVTAADGAQIGVRWYRPRVTHGDAAVLYVHGGGMILGSVATFDGPVSRYVAATGVPMLSVDYRLAPEHPHPTPVEDCFSGLVWLVDQAAELGVAPDRIGVMGDSAGGGLAAAVAIAARDRQGPPLARQILVYPMLDDRTLTADPHLTGLLAWTADDNVTGWSALLGSGHEHRAVDPNAAPGRLRDATRLPPAYLEVGQLDLFRDETVRYALALSAAGVEVELHVHPGVPHVFDSLAPTSAVVRRALADRHRVIASL